jgi:hypothetical protein
MKKIRYIIVIALFLITATVLDGQETAIPFDNKGSMYVLDEKGNEKVNLFHGDGTFKEARLYASDDSTFFLEITYEKASKTFRDRKKLNNNELLLLRQKVEQELIFSTKPEVNQEGRGWMLAATTWAGITLYGSSLPTAFNLSTRIAVGVYMLTAGSGFFIPYLLTKDEPVTYGQANLVYYGLSRGYAHGALFQVALQGNDPSIESVNGTAFFVGIGESYFAYKAVKKWEIGNGAANLMVVYGDFGFLGSFAIANQLDLFESGSGLATTVLAGSYVGLGIGYCLGKDGLLSAGDAEIIRTTTYLGAYLPLGILLEIKPHNSKAFTTTMFLTGVAGAFVGHQLVKDHDFQFMQGAIVELGTLAGGLVGAGVGFMINNENPNWTVSSAAVGAMVSFGLMYKYYANKSIVADKGNFGFNFYPQNYFALKQKNIQPQYLSNYPLISIIKRF